MLNADASTANIIAAINSLYVIGFHFSGANISKHKAVSHVMRSCKMQSCHGRKLKGSAVTLISKA